MLAELRVLMTCEVPATLGADTISGFIHELRRRSARGQVDVVMAFDGARAVHLVEGALLAVEGVAQWMMSDVRFDDWRVRWREGPVARVLKGGFELACPAEDDPGDSGLLEPVFVEDGRAAFEALMASLPGFDR